jgi:hypothetical protein
MASILFYFLLRLSLIASETITLHPPCDPRWSPVLSRPSPVAPVCFWLVVVFVSVVLHPFEAAAYSIPFIFCQSIRRPVQGDNIPPHVPPWSRLLSNVPPNVEADFYLIVMSPNKKATTTVEVPHSSLYFFCFQLAAPNEGQMSSPHVSPRSRALPETPSNVDADCCLIVACFH